MRSRVDRVAEICDRLGQLLQSGKIEDIRRELERILESDQFRSSQRSRIFLECIVKKAIQGKFDELKERVLGIELFGRDPSFDTDHDSVVRVAANDVRKRLREYYLGQPRGGVRINLLPGLYVPEIIIDSDPPLGGRSIVPASTLVRKRWRWRVASLALLGCSLAVVSYLEVQRRSSSAHAPDMRELLPWSALLQSREPINVVLADANLVFTQAKLGYSISIDAYANRRFDYAADIPHPFGKYLNDLPVTSVSDAILAAHIIKLADVAGVQTRLRYCNRFQIAELKTGEPTIFLGSPMSDPWVALFYNQLNFQLVHRFDLGADVCINRQPKRGEQQVYIPSQNGRGLSEAYALIALTPNLAGTAPVLIIAGTSSEGTQAAGELVTNPERLAVLLKKLGIGRHSRSRNLEVVIKTAYVSASSSRSEVVAYRVW